MGHRKAEGWLTLQPQADPVDGPEFLSEAEEVDGKVRLQTVQESRDERREVEIPGPPLSPQPAGASQQEQQQKQQPR